MFSGRKWKRFKPKRDKRWGGHILIWGAWHNCKRWEYTLTFYGATL